MDSDVLDKALAITEDRVAHLKTLYRTAKFCEAIRSGNIEGIDINFAPLTRTQKEMPVLVTLLPSKSNGVIELEFDPNDLWDLLNAIADKVEERRIDKVPKELREEFGSSA